MVLEGNEMKIASDNCNILSLFIYWNFVWCSLLGYSFRLYVKLKQPSRTQWASVRKQCDDKKILLWHIYYLNCDVIYIMPSDPRFQWDS